MTAYYNEYDAATAAWLRQLIKNGDIADGEVDERSITDVTAADLRGFTQHHFFAGIGTWSYALRRAGWSDARPVCTASLPCQPFSAAGKDLGKDDPRHLLPHFLDLVRECRFDTIVGEQVPGAIKHGWLDDLYDEMERESYAVGSTIITAAGAGSPHIRQRVYWVAESRIPNAVNKRSQRWVSRGANQKWEAVNRRAGSCGSVGGVADTDNQFGGIEQQKQRCIGKRAWDESCGGGDFGWLGDTEYQQCQRGIHEYRKELSESRGGATGEFARPSEIDWLYCADGKHRPIKSGIKPLVNGVARGVVYRGGAIDADNNGFNRTARIKGYGNAIQADTAIAFIKAYMSVI